MIAFMIPQDEVVLGAVLGAFLSGRVEARQTKHHGDLTESSGVSPIRVGIDLCRV